MNKKLKNELLEFGFNKNLNYILKKCIEISSSLTGLSKKLYDIEADYHIKLFQTDLFDSVRESKKWQLECIMDAANNIVEISEELISIMNNEIGSFEDLSVEELKQRFNVIKEDIIERSSTVLSMCNPEYVSLHYNNTEQTCLLFARLFKIAAEMKKKEYDSIDHIVSMFFEISIRGHIRNK